MKLKLLGTGSVKSAPVYGCECKACFRAKVVSEYKRTPSSLLVDTGDFQLLVDAGQLDLTNRFPPRSISHILLTHYHMDHVQGLFHLRWGDERLSIKVIGPDDPKGSDDLFKNPGILDFSQKTRSFERFSLGDIHITPLPMIHSKITHGYFIQHNNVSVAYITDTCGLEDSVIEFLRKNNPTLLLLDCSFPPRNEAPNNHNDLTTALEIHYAVRSDNTILTHIGHDMDEWLINHSHEIPNGIRIAEENSNIVL